MMTPTKERALLAALHIALPSGRKGDKDAAKEVTNIHGAEEGTASVSKQVIAKSALEPLKEFAGASRLWHYKHSSPWCDDGRRFLPNRHFMTYADEMRKREGEFVRLKGEFLAKYDQLKATAKATMGTLFSEEEFPTLETLENKFEWKVTFDPVPAGEDIRLDMQKEDLDALRADLDKRVNDATRAAQLDLYRRLADPLMKMAERLSDPGNKFKDSLVGNLAEACEIIPQLNLDDDPLLLALVKAAKDLTLHAPETLRTAPNIRNDVAKRAKEIADQMSAFCPK